jgi:hypothetical protein
MDSVLFWFLGGARFAMPRLDFKMSDKRTVIRALLILLSFDAVITTVMLVFGGRAAVVRFLPDAAKVEATDLFLANQLQFAGFRIGLVVMWLLAFREPEKNRAVIIGTSVGLIALGISVVIAPQLLSLKPLYPFWMPWSHAIMRCTFGVSLFLLLPSSGSE